MNLMVSHVTPKITTLVYISPISNENIAQARVILNEIKQKLTEKKKCNEVFLMSKAEAFYRLIPLKQTIGLIDCVSLINFHFT